MICATSKLKGLCVCVDGYYWNGTLCTKLLTYMYLKGECTSNYNCDKNLLFLNKACTCDAIKVIDPLTQRCKYNYLGCYEYNETTNYYLAMSLSQREMFKFVQICISTCKYQQETKYTSLNVESNYIICECLNNNIFTLPSTMCSITCTGSDSRERYICRLGNVLYI